MIIHGQYTPASGQMFLLRAELFQRILEYLLDIIPGLRVHISCTTAGAAERSESTLLNANEELGVLCIPQHFNATYFF